MSKIFYIWNRLSKLIEFAEKTDGDVNVMSADPNKNCSLTNIEDIEEQKSFLRDQGVSEDEIQKLDDALNS